MIELRYFLGCTVEERAELLGRSLEPCTATCRLSVRGFTVGFTRMQ